jgi:exodeoxyribonuclease V gamma subunit
MSQDSVKHRVELWIHHLALSLALSGAKPAETRVSRFLFGRGDKKERSVAGPAHPRAVLLGLLNLYWEGLSSPLPLFPGASMAWAEARARGKTTEEARTAALDRWAPFEGRAERDDPAFALCFPVKDPTALDRFAAVAEAAYAPLLEGERMAKG